MPRIKTWLAAAAVTAGALTFGGGAATTVTASAYHQPSARFLSQARTALVHYLRDNHPTLLLAYVGRAHGSNAVTEGGSYNWSGYADESTKDGTFTKVSGAWAAPKVTCTAEDTITSEWVGLDGANSATVEQDGTIGWCYEGKPTYFTWYEMYPAGTIEVGKTLAPGDKISASVSRSGTKYTLKLTDSTHTADSFSKSATCAATTCLDTSAEWIAERSSFSIGIAPLADYATWKLTSGAETADGKSGTIGSYATVDELQMIDATEAYTLSTPTSLTSGNSFTTTWDNSW
jgi:predicted lipoprotein with Yx(FWY)xxD motif